MYFLSHAIPSRMTIANLVECLTAKKNALNGISMDDSATTFTPVDIEKIGRELVKHGYHAMGKQPMISGTTGEMMPMLIFMGPCYYQQCK